MKERPGPTGWTICTDSKSYQELSYEEGIVPNPSYGQYFLIRLRYRSRDEQSMRVEETLFFIFSLAGRLDQVDVCE